MAAALLPWTNIPAYKLGTSHAGNQRGLALANRSTIKIILNNHVRMRGLRASAPSFRTSGFNRLGTPVHFKVEKFIVAPPCGRGRRCVAAKSIMSESCYTDEAITVIMVAQDEVRRLGHNFLGTEQILLGIIGESTGIAAKVLKSMGIQMTDARTEVEKLIGRGPGGNFYEFTFHAKRVLEHSSVEAKQLGHNYIGTEHLLLGLIQVGDGGAIRVLQNLGADVANSIRKQVIEMVEESKTLEEYFTDLTKLAAEGKLDPFIGRETQIERVTEILSSRMKNNPCLIGEPGVGKTAIAEGLAQRISSGHVPKTIQGKKVITLNMALLIAGMTLVGQFEKQLKKIMEEIKQRGDIILFIDEIHTLTGVGGGAAANIMKPALARGELQCIGATTLNEYKNYIEKDSALERRFQPVKVPEPTVDESIQILKVKRRGYPIYTSRTNFSSESDHLWIRDRDNTTIRFHTPCDCLWIRDRDNATTKCVT